MSMNDLDLLGHPIPDPKDLPRNKRLSSFDDLIGHTIMHIFEEDDCIDNQMVIVTETRCHLEVNAVHGDCDEDDPRIQTTSVLGDDSNAHKANEAWHQAASPELVISLLDRVAELEAQQAVPHGWKLVPVEPTDAQLATVRSPKLHPNAPDRWDSNNRRIYMHMLAAAPLPPGDDTEVVAAKPKHQDYWICLLCGSSRPGHHRVLDDGTTPCPN